MLPLVESLRERSSASGGAGGVRSGPVLSPEAVLAGWYAEAATGRTALQPRLLRLEDGRLLPLPVDRWAGPVSAGDLALLARADGPVLDVGCGPGRLTAALHERGTDVLGLDVLPDAPVLARAVGAPVASGSVFGPVPGAGRWRTVLLADGNVGIGGDPVALLRRSRALLADGGRVLVELHGPGEPPAVGRVRLEGLGRASAWFPWALLGRRGLPAAASAAGLAVVDQWSCDDRPFAALAPLPTS